MATISGTILGTSGNDNLLGTSGEDLLYGLRGNDTTTLGFSRVVYSSDLGDGGGVNVLANLTNLTNLSDQANFSAQDFYFVTLT